MHFIIGDLYLFPPCCPVEPDHADQRAGHPGHPGGEQGRGRGARREGADQEVQGRWGDDGKYFAIF